MRKIRKFLWSGPIYPDTYGNWGIDNWAKQTQPLLKGIDTSFKPKVTNGSPAKLNVPSVKDLLTASGISSITGWASDQLADNIFGDSEVGRNVGNIFSLGVSSFGNTLANNVIKGEGLFQGAGINTGSAVAGAAAGMAANYIGKGINSLGGDSMLSRGLGQGVATGLGTVGGTVASNLVQGKSLLNGIKGMSSSNLVGLGGQVVGSALGAAFGPSKEYNGKYGGITRGMDTAYDLVQGAIGFIPGWGQIASGAMALNKGLSNIFGSTDGMTRLDAILGSAFMPAPVKWLNMAGAKTTQNFNNQSWQNTERTNSFMQNGFGDLGDRLTKAREEAGKTYGTFSQGARKRADLNLLFANQAWQRLLDMTDTNEMQNIRSLYMTSINNLRYALMIQGGWSPLARGKYGMKILNNATNHNIGQRLLSGAALIDNKQMILSAQGGIKVMRPRMKPHRKGEQPVYTEEEKKLLAEWDAHVKEVRRRREEAIERRVKTNAEHALRYSNLATAIAETTQRNTKFEPVTLESLQNSNTELLKQEQLADKNEYFDNGMKFINAAGFADLGINVVAPLLLRGFRWAFNKAGLLVKVPVELAYSTEIRSPYYKVGQDGNLTFDTENVISQIKSGKQDFINEILSPEYAEAAIRNMEEAEKMGLSYTPVFEKPAFKSLIEDGIIPKFVQDPKHAWHARTSFFGGTPGKATEIEYNLSQSPNIRQATGHESGHVSKWGMGETKGEHEFMKYKASLIFKDEGDVGVYEFGSLTGEAATNMRDLGKQMGITQRTPYPGYEEALKRLKEAEVTSNKGGIVRVLKLTKEAMPYIWRALQGLHFEYAIPLTTAASLYNTDK